MQAFRCAGSFQTRIQPLRERRVFDGDSREHGGDEFREIVRLRRGLPAARQPIAQRKADMRRRPFDARQAQQIFHHIQR